MSEVISIKEARCAPDATIQQVLDALRVIPLVRPIIRDLYKKFKNDRMAKAVPKRLLQDIGTNVTSLTESIVLNIDDSQAEAAMDFLENALATYTWPGGLPPTDQERRWARFLLTNDTTNLVDVSPRRTAA